MSAFSFTQFHRLIRATTVRITAVKKKVTRSFRFELTGRLISSLASKLQAGNLVFLGKCFAYVQLLDSVYMLLFDQYM